MTEGGWSKAPAPADVSAAQSLPEGVVLSGRYQILKMLGQGGMGAVYKAQDLELDRTVAVKVIRPELAADPKALARFKQEIILARQITHRNVIRIFDLGTHEGFKYITMEFVEGRDLAAVRSEKQLPVDEAVRIMRQVCRALEAAHNEKVIHRDLKPQNIMVDGTGRVHVMDFGLARSVEMSGMTQTGALLGTPAYMSPEQAKGIPVDERSDIFSFGIILYELLTGKTPFQADTVWATLLSRTQAPPPPPVTLVPQLAPLLNQIVMKCLAIDPEQRYRTAAEVAYDLETWQQGVPTLPPTLLAPAPQTASPAPAAAVTRKSQSWKWVAIAGALLVIAAGAVFVRGKFISKPAPTSPVTVLVADFNNQTGDPIFDGTLEPMFNVALEGAKFINAYSRGDARKAAAKLPNATGKLDEQAARLIAVSQGIGAVVTGELSQRGSGYKLSVEALDAQTGKTISSGDVTEPTKDGLLLAVPKLAAPIRKALGDSTPESAQLDAARGTFTAASLEAVHQYGIAMELQFAGKMEQALQAFTKATELDPNFARAWAGMAGTSGNLNRMQDAQKYLKTAMEHVDRMTERERYRTRGLYYRKAGDLQKCVEEYSELVRQFPADNIGHQNLANCYSDLRNIPKAIDEQRQAVAIAPKSAMQRRNLSLLAAYGGDAPASEREARASLQLNPSYEKAYLPLAYSQLLQGKLAEAADTYRQLEKVSKLGSSYASSGIADIALYEGRFSEAAKSLEEGIRSDSTAPNLFAAEKLGALAYVDLLRGDKKAAIEAAQRASESRKANVRFLAGRIFVQAGDIAKARSISAALASDSQLEPQVDAKIIDGDIALQSGNSLEAIKTITDANRMLDTWLGRFDLGRAYLEAGQFTEADSEFDRCIERRGEALELDDLATYGYFPAVYFYQGRVRDGLKSPGAAESYRTYLNIRGKAGEDPLLPDVRRRAGQ